MNQPRKSKVWLKRIGIGIGLIILLSVCFLTIEHFRGEATLTRYLADLKKSGEVFDVASLKPTWVPLDQNGFSVLTGLTNSHDSILTNVWQGPPLLQLIEPGKSSVAWRLKEWEVDEKSTNTWQEFGSELDRAKATTELIRSATRKLHYDAGFNYDNGFVDFKLPPIVTAKQGAQLLCAATLNDLRNHRAGSAHSNLCAAIKLSAMQEPEPLVICQLVRIACGAIAFNTTWQALQWPEWNDDQLAEMQSAWQHARFPEDMARALGMERAMTLDHFQKLRNSSAALQAELKQREKVGEFMGQESDSQPTHGFILNYLHIPIWRFAWAAQDEVRALTRWQTIIERERYARTNSWSALASGSSPNDEIYLGILAGSDAKNLNLYDRLRYLISNEPFSINDLVIRKELQMRTLQQLAVTAIALQRFHLATGVFPNTLGDLAPRFLNEVPRDDMDGKPLRYRRISESQFLLYSVGFDGNDDDGDPSPTDMKKPIRQVWDGKDAVWPTPVEHR